MAYLTAFNAGAFAKLIKVLGIPSNASKAALSMNAGDLVTLTITRPLTTEEVEAATQVLTDADLEPIPLGTISYNFRPRDEVAEEAECHY